MKIKNYKNIRSTPLIFGFSFQSAIIFGIIALLSFSLFMSGFTIKKTIIVGVINFISFLVCKYVFGEQNVFDTFLNQKFPNELNDFTKNGKQNK